MLSSFTNAGWHSIAIWSISLLAIALVLIRPRGWSEAWWASLGAGLLVIARLIPLSSAAHAVAQGTDVYLFLIGMMIMSELARREGVFDWIAAHAVHASRNSPSRLLLLVYCFGTIVTIFLSNDATAVVLTPAVLAAVRAAGLKPFPYLMACAFIANAASFVLPISNPANLVVYGATIPPLGRWLLTFGCPSIASILVTYLVLRWLARAHLLGGVNTNVLHKPLSPSGRITVYGIFFLAGVLMTASALDQDLGAPACAAGLLVAIIVSFGDRGTPKDVVKEVSWSVLPLVAGLFVIVEALNHAGALRLLILGLHHLSTWPSLSAALTSGFGIAFLSNLMNNLPSGLICGAAVKSSTLVAPVRDALLLGVDIGPNLSVTGSLATILWLIAIRRDGEEISFWVFLKWGAVAMPPALALAILVRVLAFR